MHMLCLTLQEHGLIIGHLWNKEENQEENKEPGFPEQPRVPRLAEVFGLPGLAEHPGYLEMTSDEIPGLTDNSDSESDDEFDIRQFYRQHQLYDALKESMYDLFLQ